jgi:hypothetical protein
MSKPWLSIAIIALGLVPAYLVAQEAGEPSDADKLAKALSNPVAALISVPLQFNYDTGYGEDGDGDRWTLNVQPVIPVGISDDWNMISRTIVPVIEQSGVLGVDSQSGIGDITQSLFFSPKKPVASGWIFGLGPAFLLPTATNNLIGTEKWAIGPTAVVLKQTEGGWTYGALVNHLWSVAGEDARADVSSTFLQPFLSKGIGKGRTITVNFESSYDWKSDQWTAPLNLTYSKVTKLGSQMVSFAFCGRGYLESPAGGPDWGVRFAVTLLFPKK